MRQQFAARKSTRAYAIVCAYRRHTRAHTWVRDKIYHLYVQTEIVSVYLFTYKDTKTRKRTGSSIYATQVHQPGLMHVHEPGLRNWPMPVRAES